MTDNISFFQSRIIIYQKDINQFAIDMFDFDADEWQKEFFNNVVNNPRTAVKSGQGVGKTAATAIVILWFLSCFPFARVVATAPTGHQLHDVLWSELSKWQSQSPILSEILKWTKTYIYLKGMEKRWFAVARTSNKAENMQGFHEDNLLFVVDEASGVMDAIIEAINGTLSGVNNKLVILGNPTQTAGFFYEAFTVDRDLYATQTVDSEKSPRTNKENIAALKRKYGEDSNVVRVRVKGLFPLEDNDVFIPITLVEKSIYTNYTLDNEEITSIDIGCDVARFGDDKTVISFKVNKKVEIYKSYIGKDLMRTANEVAALFLKLTEKYKFLDRVPVKVDDGGLGGGVTDKLRELKRNDPERFSNMMIVPILFGKPIKHKYFADTTTFMMNVVKELISSVDDEGNEKEVDVVLPNDSDLVAQLSMRKYEFTSKSKIKIESKEKMKERIGHSPDEADSILLVCMPVKTKKGKKDKTK